MFQDSVVVLLSGGWDIHEDISTHKDDTDTLSEHIRNQLPSDMLLYPKRTST
jgi:hypothetical protein